MGCYEFIYNDKFILDSNKEFGQVKKFFYDLPKLSLTTMNNSEEKILYR